MRPATSRSRRLWLSACALAAVVVWTPSSSTASAQLVPGSCGSCSDFDGDGFADLAVGTPREDVGPAHNVGAANVLYGSGAGLQTSGSDLWHQDVPGVPDDGEDGDLIAFALATGDFDGDGYADLAMGAPFEDLREASNAGAVFVLYGSDAGLAVEGAQMIDEATSGVPDRPEAGDQFGYALAAGDLDGDGHADLAVGIHREDVRGAPNAGAVHVIPGSSEGLATASTSEWNQSTPGFGDAPGEEDHLGSAVVIADFDGDAYADLAAGAPRENLYKFDDGIVHVLYGSAAGITTERAEMWTQNVAGVPDRSESGDLFGSALRTGDLDGDGIDDLAVALAGESVGVAKKCGAVQVLFGTPAGLSAEGSQFWHQDSTDEHGPVGGTAGSGDGLGTGLAVGDVDGDGIDDLAMGARYDDEDPGYEDTGAVNVLLGSAGGPTTEGQQFWTQSSAGLAGDLAEGRDHFGSVLAIGRFGPGPASDLVIGVHFETVGASTFAGAMHVLPGTISGPSVPGMFLTQSDLDAGEGTEPYDYFPFALGAG